MVATLQQSYAITILIAALIISGTQCCTWKHDGCFQDHLQVPIVGSDSSCFEMMAAQQSATGCQELCKSLLYKVAGICEGDICCCGHQPNRPAAPIKSGCKPCVDNKAEFCGGNATMDVYSCSDGQSKSNNGNHAGSAVSVTAGGALMPAVNPYNVEGIDEEELKQLLNDPVLAKTLGATELAVMKSAIADADVKSQGSKFEQKPVLASTSGSNNKPSVSVPPLSSAVKSAPPSNKPNAKGKQCLKWEHIGHFEDLMSFPLLWIKSNQNPITLITPAKCQEACRQEGYSWAGVGIGFDGKNNHVCYCDRSFPRRPYKPSQIIQERKLGDSAPRIPCPGQSEKQLCGGAGTVDLYYCHECKWKSHGCLENTANLLQQSTVVEVDQLLTPKKCRVTCINHGYKLAGLMAGKCQCAMNMKEELAKVSDSCNQKCAGKSVKTCGGVAAWELFQCVEVSPPAISTCENPKARGFFNIFSSLYCKSV